MKSLPLSVSLFVVLALMGVAILVSSQQAQVAHAQRAEAAKAEKAAAAKTATAVKTTPVEADAHEFMEYYFEPTYKRLKVSMAAEPTDKSTWKGIKSDALILAEGGNLLLDRTPSEDGEAWNKYSVATRELAAQLYQAAKAKDYKAGKLAYYEMLFKCNACHHKFNGGEPELTP